MVFFAGIWQDNSNGENQSKIGLTVLEISKVEQTLVILGNLVTYLLAIDAPDLNEEFSHFKLS